MRLLIFNFLVNICFISVFSQKQDNVWVFGYHNGLDFNSGSPVFWESDIHSMFPSASVSDEDGDLLFYTNGFLVYEADGTVMPNGILYLVDYEHYIFNTGSQKSYIVKSITNNDQYYIIQHRYVDLQYTLVDMSLNGGKGDVVMKNVPLAYNISAATIAKGGDCFSYWIIGKNPNESMILSYKIDKNGISTMPVETHGVYFHEQNMIHWDIMEISPDMNMVFTTRHKYSTGIGNNLADGFELRKFDNETGLLHTPIYVSLDSGENRSINTIAFSPNSRYLYAIESINIDIHTAYYELYQYDLSYYPDVEAIKLSKKLINGEMNTSYLRTAPDDKIYISTGFYKMYSNNQTIMYNNYMSCIHNPNAGGDDCNFEEVALIYPDYAQFPRNANEEWFPKEGCYGAPLPSIVYQTSNTIITGRQIHYLCPSSPLELSVEGDYDRYEWHDGDTSPSHIFTEPGLYWVYKYRDCTLTIDSFEIVEVSVNMLSSDTFVCRIFAEELILTATANISSTFYWNTGSTDSQIVVRESGTYVVTYVNDCGVFSDTVQVVMEDDCDCTPLIPNAFSPNGDGLNDRFRIQSICPMTSDYRLTIYNRYGDRVFVSTHIEHTWDGTFQGILLPSGVYYYSLEYLATDGSKKHLRGDVTLLR